MTMLTEIAGYLASAGLGTVGVDLFIEEIPATPDLCSMLFQSAGMGQELTMAGAGDRKPALQIRVRSAENDPGAGIAKIEAIAAALHGIANTTIGSTKYRLIRSMGDWGYIGNDDQGRPERTQNFLLVKA
jgi:hypothetical protein